MSHERSSLVIHGDDRRGGAPQAPDGPPPAREQLPLPRRRRQAHLEPRLRAAGDAGSGTPFAAFTADDSTESPGPGRDEGTPARDVPAREAPARNVPGREVPARNVTLAVERAAAFQAAAYRARGAARTRPGRREQNEP